MAKAKKEVKEQPVEQVLWAAADKLRKNMDAAEYKHIVLGLIFLQADSRHWGWDEQRLVWIRRIRHNKQTDNIPPAERVFPWDGSVYTEEPE